jgi:hypothetical protein
MYQPKLARFESRDPLAEDGVTVLWPAPDLRTGGYQYVGARPTVLGDPSGLRDVVIQLYYYWPTLNQTRGWSRHEVEHLMETWINAAIEQQTGVPAKHRVIVRMYKVGSKAELDGRQKGRFAEGGCEGTLGYSFRVTDDLGSGVVGKESRYRVQLSPSQLSKELASSQSGAGMSKLIAMVLSHEVVLHGVGRKSRHYHWSDFLDARSAEGSIAFSPEMAERLVKEIER